MSWAIYNTLDNPLEQPSIHGLFLDPKKETMIPHWGEEENCYCLACEWERDEEPFIKASQGNWEA